MPAFFYKNILMFFAAIIGAASLSLVLTGVLEFPRKHVESHELFGASIAPARLPVTENVFFASAKDNPDYMPIRNWTIEEPVLDAAAAIVIIPAKNKILFKENIDEQRPIASLTKLMTAVVLLDNISNLKEEEPVKSSHIMAEGESGDLVVGESLSFAGLLKIMLIASSNDAAEVVAEAVGSRIGGDNNILKTPRDFFVEKMNEKAGQWGLKDTHFSTPTGLEDENNFSTAKNLANLAMKISIAYPEIWRISVMPVADVKDSTGLISHHLINTNKLVPFFDDIVGSKTGYTEGAKGNIIIIQQDPVKKDNIIYIILGSSEKFSAVKSLIDWVHKAYLW